MKLVKCLPAVAAVVLLAACENASAPAKNDTNSQAETKVSSAATQSVNYVCSANGKNAPVSATYSFENNKPQLATVSLDGKIIGENLKLDTSYTDGIQFIDDKNVWTLSEAFTADNPSKAYPIMFTVKGKESDTIVAKDCSVAK